MDKEASRLTRDGHQAPDGTISVIYDHDRYSEEAKEILMAVFTEEDAVQGQAVSGKVRLKVLVNRATGKRAKPAN